MAFFDDFLPISLLVKVIPLHIVRKTTQSTTATEKMKQLFHYAKL